MLSVSPTSYDFGAVTQGSTPSKDFSVNNTGGGTLQWEVSSWPSWVELVSPLGGVVGNTGTITVRVKSSAPVGSQSGSITVTSNGGTKIITVLVASSPPPTKPNIWSVTVNKKCVEEGKTVLVPLDLAAGDAFEVCVHVFNDGYDSPAFYNNISLSFPSFTSGSDKERVWPGEASSDLNYGEYHGADGGGGPDGYYEYVYVEAQDVDGWHGGDLNYLEVRVRPKDYGTFVIYVRAAMSNQASWSDGWTYAPTSGERDATGKFANKIALCVVPPPVTLEGVEIIRQEGPNCWAGASAMVLRYYGTYGPEPSLKQLAHELGDEKYYYEGLPPLEANAPFVAELDDALERLGKLDVDPRYVGWDFEDLKTEIDAGRPMILFLTYVEAGTEPHAIVVVGYHDAPGTQCDQVIFNDPNGYRVTEPWTWIRDRLYSAPRAKVLATSPKEEKGGISVYQVVSDGRGALVFSASSGGSLPWTMKVRKWDADLGDWTEAANCPDWRGTGQHESTVDLSANGAGEYRLSLAYSLGFKTTWQVAITRRPEGSPTPASIGTPTPTLTPTPMTTAGAVLCSVHSQPQTIKPGDEFVALVEVDPTGYGISSGDLNLSFPSSVVELLSADPGTLLGDNALTGIRQIDNFAGTLRLAMSRQGTTPSPSPEGSLAVLRFIVKSDAPPGDYLIRPTRLALADEKSADIGNIELAAGTVHVTGITLQGDANGDNLVDYRDLAVLGAAYGTGKGETGFNSAADLNGDGLVDFRDLAILGANYGKAQ